MQQIQKRLFNRRGFPIETFTEEELEEIVKKCGESYGGHKWSWMEDVCKKCGIQNSSRFIRTNSVIDNS